ncbi:MAG: MotA/TolQ/ExbB proton channel family protein [Kiritimatiellae bacterium]|nr:MotA/TolQ/ExbB proton channel family protein [Kiritimatiellia bacterium]MDD4340871.1 MotA/TolQ/ExbB proton channel family protein [Kiritimatiellia bacterium]MDY0148798.1 MotA/TolQ/ExbB proton channel family protein [Kiritimatiellia bacterium]
MKTSWIWKLAPGLLVASSASAEVEEVAPVADMLSTAEIMRMGGGLMYVLVALSVLGLALIVYYAMVLRTRNVAPPAQALRLRELLKERRYRDAREVCAQQPTALAAVAASGLDFLRENPSAQPGILKEVMESAGARQAGRIQNMIHYLLDLSAVAPMVGLLGTVIGMLKAFNSVAFDLAKARPMELAGGVGQALITTIAGLIVAIPAMMAYAWFRGRVIKLIGQMEGAATDLLAIMENRGD